MPVWLSLFIALVGATGFFGTLFALVVLVVEGRRTKAAPRMGVFKGATPGTLNVWVDWDASQFAVEVYRLRFQFIAPESAVKEGTFTVTFDAAQTASFIQPVELPENLKKLLTNPKERGLLTCDFRTVHETTIQKNYTFDRLRGILATEGKTPKIANVLPVAKTDVATVLSLDFEELQIRRKRMKDLEAAAKAKAAKAAAKPAAAPAAAAAAPAPAPAPQAAQGAVVAPSTPAAAPEAAKAETAAAPVKSVREVVSAANKPVETK